MSVPTFQGPAGDTSSDAPPDAVEPKVAAAGSPKGVAGVCAFFSIELGK